MRRIVSTTVIQNKKIDKERNPPTVKVTNSDGGSGSGADVVLVKKEKLTPLKKNKMEEIPETAVMKRESEKGTSIKSSPPSVKPEKKKSITSRKKIISVPPPTVTTTTTTTTTTTVTKPKRKTKIQAEYERTHTTTSFAMEQNMFDKHRSVRYVGGWDEVGKGCYYGCVISCVCVIERGATLLMNVRDSKRSSYRKKKKVIKPSITTSSKTEEDNDEKQSDGNGDREELCDALLRTPGHTFYIARRSSSEIDRLGIRVALDETMCEALLNVRPMPDAVFIDGDVIAAGVRNHSQFHAWAVVGGDSKCYTIAAASIVAKATRDREMRRMHSLYPHYGLAHHNGYGTAEHSLALYMYGATDQHRRSFNPMRTVLSSNQPLEKPGVFPLPTLRSKDASRKIEAAKKNMHLQLQLYNQPSSTNQNK